MKNIPLCIIFSFVVEYRKDYCKKGIYMEEDILTEEIDNNAETENSTDNGNELPEGGIDFYVWY